LADPSLHPLSSHLLSAHREHDPESGLVHMRARMYEPRVGRFTLLDPMLENRVLEHYVYVWNSPINLSDPEGLQGGIVITREGKIYNPWTPPVSSSFGEFVSEALKPARVEGALKVMGGVTGAVVLVPVVMAPEPVITKVAAGVGVGYCADLAATGIKQVITGRREVTLTHQAVKGTSLAVGANESQAEAIAQVAESGAEGVTAAVTLRVTITQSGARIISEAGKVPRTAPKTIGEIAADVPDDALVNFGGRPREVVAPPTGESYWFRKGDIKGLTPEQIEATIGPLARAGEKGGAAVMRVAKPSASGTIQKVEKASNIANVAEYKSKEPVDVIKNIMVQPESVKR
ncbi:MAG: RHS repeat-associated core domain-containing protein, partial [candidate division WOR-3 bacterium]